MQPKQFNQYRFRKTATKKASLDFTKLIGLSPALLILLGTARLGFYYERFNVYILPFLDFSEIITSFLDVTIVGIYFISCFVFIPFLLEPLMTNKKSAWFGIVQAILLIVPLFLLNLLINKFTAAVLGVVVGFLCILTLVFIFFFKIAPFIFPSSKQSLTNRYLFFIGSSLSLVIASLYFLASQQAENVKKHEKYLGVRITFNDSTQLISNPVKYYIGNTNNYLFIYDSRINTTTVSKMTDVKSISFP
jgi:hypothetical protein